MVVAWSVIHAATLESQIRAELSQRRFPLPGKGPNTCIESVELTPFTTSSSPEPPDKKRRTQLATLFHSGSQSTGMSILGSTIVHHID